MGGPQSRRANALPATRENSKLKVNFCLSIFGRKTSRERLCDELLYLFSPRMLLDGGARVL